MSKNKKKKEINKYIELAAERFAEILITQIENTKGKVKNSDLKSLKL